MHLVEERKRRQWSQQEVADFLGTTQRNVSRWELGLTTPGPYFRAKLCELFGKSAEELDLFSEQADREQAVAPAPDRSFPTRERRLPLWSVPFQRTPFFCGRDEILHRLHSMLKQQHLTTALTQSYALSGLGGIGKTQIALEYVYRYASHYSAIFWISAETQETLLSSFALIAELLGLLDQQEQDQYRVVRAVTRWLDGETGWLLVLDNVEDLNLLTRFLPASRGGSLLLTTRLQALGPLAQQLTVEPMEREEGLRFLLQRARKLKPGQSLGQIASMEIRSAQEIVEALDGLPLALDQVGAYIEETQCSLQDYLQRYHQRRSLFLGRRGDSSLDHPTSTAATLSLSFQQVERKSPVAADLLQVCAFLTPDAISEALIRRGAAHLGDQLQTISTDPCALDEAIAVLRAYSLVHRDAATQSLSVHRLVQAVLQDGMSQQMQDTWIQRLIHVLEQAFPTESHQMECWPWCEHLVPHVSRVLTFREHGADPLEISSLWYKTGIYFQNRARYLEAQSSHQQALDLREQVLGSQHEGLVDPLIGLMEATWFQHKYPSVIPHAQRVISLLEHTQGARHTTLIKPLNFLALVHGVQGQLAEAEGLLLRALSIWVATTLSDVSRLDHSPGGVPSQGEKEQDAESLIQQALSLWEQAPQLGFTQLGQTLVILGSVYQQQQRSAEADAILLPSLQLGKQILGEKHPLLAYPLMFLAAVYKEQGRLQEAEQCYHQALTIREQVLGASHPQTMETRTAYAALLEAAGRILPADQGIVSSHRTGSTELLI